jgi:hypothetical protein
MRQERQHCMIFRADRFVGKTPNIYTSLSAIILRDEKLSLCGLSPTYQFGGTGSSPCTPPRPSLATGAHHILVSLVKRQQLQILDILQTIYVIDASSSYFFVS